MHVSLCIQIAKLRSTSGSVKAKQQPTCIIVEVPLQSLSASQQQMPQSSALQVRVILDTQQVNVCDEFGGCVCGGGGGGGGGSGGGGGGCPFARFVSCKNVSVGVVACEVVCLGNTWLAIILGAFKNGIWYACVRNFSVA